MTVKGRRGLGRLRRRVLGRAKGESAWHPTRPRPTTVIYLSKSLSLSLYETCGVEEIGLEPVGIFVFDAFRAALRAVFRVTNLFP